MRKRGSRWTRQIVLICCLLILPVLGLIKLRQVVDLLFIIFWLVSVSIAALFLNWRDKTQAQKEQWRIPETTLHLLELFGGWPAAYIAQRLFHHKTSKIRYQVFYWTIVAAWQLVSFDYLTGWALATGIISIFSG